MATQRWTDEMLDNLAVSIESLRDTVLAHDRQNKTFRDTILAHDRQNEIFRETILAHDRQNEIFRETILAHDRQNEIFRQTILAHDRQNEERDQRTADLEEQMQIMAIGINRLVESDIEYKRWKVETDRRIEESNQRIEESNQRFYILLEEIRSVNRRVEVLEN
jgi:hypothetical protein